METENMHGECERLVWRPRREPSEPNMQKKGRRAKNGKSEWENRGKIDVATCDMGVSFDVVKGIELILNAGENIQGLETPGIGDEWMNDCDIYGTYRFRLRYTAGAWNRHTRRWFTRSGILQNMICDCCEQALSNTSIPCRPIWKGTGKTCLKDVDVWECFLVNE